MSGKKKVSVCIPAFNNEEETARALQSLSRQTFRDFELCLSDDSDEDGVESVTGLFQKNNPDIPVTYRRNTPKKGHIFNWNAAIGLAGGTYIKILFSDDFLTDESALGEFCRLLDAHPEADLAFSGSRQVLFGDRQDLAHLQDASITERAASDAFLDAMEKDWRRLFLGNEIGAPSAVIFRASTGARFDEKSGWASDMFLYADLLRKNPHFAFTKAPLVSIGMHAGQYTESFSEKDERIYDDYRYFYTKYDLEKSRACRDYFLSEFVAPYHRPFSEARSLGFTRREYDRAVRGELSATIRSFLHARFSGHQE